LSDKVRNVGLGRYVGLRPITTTTITTTEHDDNNNKTKIMQISLHSFNLLCNHSHKYHDQPISYDECIEELCTFYNKEHQTNYFHLTRI
jgi:hypothetical protein